MADKKSPKKKSKEIETKEVELKQPSRIIYGKVTNGEYLIPDGIPRRKKVCVLGFAPSSMKDCRHYFGDPEWEFWGLNQMYLVFPELMPHVTRWFQLHHRHHYDQAIRDHKHHDWLAAQVDFPIYMRNKEPDIPMSVPFPVSEMINQFGRYFTNSISWMIALAIYERFESISIFGVDMAQTDEYIFQRPSVEYFCGIVEGMDRFARISNEKETDKSKHLPRMKLYIPEASDLLKTAWLYPFEDDRPFTVKIEARRKELRDRINQCAGQEQASHDERLQLIGAIENLNYIDKNFVNAAKTLEGYQFINKDKK